MLPASSRRSSCLWLLIAALGLAAAGLTLLWALRLPRPNCNALAIGEAARVDFVDIVLQPPAELDFLSKAEVLQLRQEAVQQHPELLAHAYRPSDDVFGRIVSGLPWWGMTGEFYYGKGEKSIAGPSEEARFILNPYLLVAADFYSWWGGEIGEAEAAFFSMTCLPRDLRWRPRERLAEVTYDAGCIASGQDYAFDLIAYNARDLNLDHIFVSYADSLHVTKPDSPTAVYANPQFIHKGGSCGYPGGCNNMSPATPAIDGLVIQALPARVVIWLWDKPPASLKQAPDITFTIHFR